MDRSVCALLLLPLTTMCVCVFTDKKKSSKVVEKAEK